MISVSEIAGRLKGEVIGAGDKEIHIGTWST